MNLIFFSDTHTKHDQLKLADVLSFANFMTKANYKYKIVIAGNGIIYLNDSGISISGVKIC